MTGNDIFLKQFKDIVKSQFKIGHEDTNDLMFTGQRVAWKMQEKTKKEGVHLSRTIPLCSGID